MKDVANHLNVFGYFNTFEGNQVERVLTLKMRGINPVIEVWKGSGPIKYRGDLSLAIGIFKWDDNVFIVKLERDGKGKKWMFYAGMPKNEEDCAMYRARFTLKDRKKTILSTVMTSEIVPLDLFFSRKDVAELGAFCSVTDRAMQNMFYINGEYDYYVKFGIIIEIIKL